MRRWSVVRTAAARMRFQLASGPLPEGDFSRAIQRMKTELRIVEFIAIKN